ncbi:MAG: phosphatase PAP2 family protein [Oscillospiraceae bacterium]|jgi:undecaprenyl-diphosphatase|nr:phosphatase PAP2 family protein [Oscillospiraceae bacterium]
MEMTAAASWLMDAFSGIDLGILSLMHTFAEHAGGLLTPLCKLITLLGEKGILFFLLSIGLMCFARTRPLGVCIFGAVCCGALITNILLKDWVARPRPFETLAVYRDWWRAIGSPAEDGFSFPSGHVTAAAAGMGAICFMRGRRWVWPAVGVVLVMMFARNYLMAHFPSDVIAAALIGLFSAWVAYLITMQIFAFFSTRKKGDRLADFVMHYSIPVPAWLTYKGRH